MKLYLSSYKVGDESEELLKMVSAENRTAAYIPNAFDAFGKSDSRKAHEQEDMDQLRNLGFQVERLDLQDYFGKQQLLEQKLEKTGLLWVSGGNVFALRQAMRLSGFDELIHTLSNSDIVYGGYSAGACVLSPTLCGLDIVDDANAKPYGEEYETIWDGLGIIDFAIAPHYQSDHPESADIDKEIAYCKGHGIPCKPLRDGEVIVEEVI